jgi:hypothetical protein
MTLILSIGAKAGVAHAAAGAAGEAANQPKSSSAEKN